MDIRIQAIHFDASQKLVDFINRKAERLVRRFTTVSLIDITLKVVKPETAMNKQVTIKIAVPQQDDVVADKTADTFEEAVDLALEALERQLEKHKNS